MTPQPDTAFVVCATPRSGSTLLCELLAQTGVAGRPEEYFEFLYATNQPRQPRQYFEGVSDPEVLDLLKPTVDGVPESAEAFEERLNAALRDGTTPNGVWSSKLMWGYLLDFLRRLRERQQTEHMVPHQALAEVFGGDLRYVHVRRRDKVAQAVSLWTAVQTAQWRQESDEQDGPPPEPVYSRAGIAHLVEQLTNQDQAWLTWFINCGIEPITVVYEDLIQSLAKNVLELLRALQIDIAGVEIKAPSMRRQAGGRSAEWADRFGAERRVPA